MTALAGLRRAAGADRPRPRLPPPGAEANPPPARRRRRPPRPRRAQQNYDQLLALAERVPHPCPPAAAGRWRACSASSATRRSLIQAVEQLHEALVRSGRPGADRTGRAGPAKDPAR